jgi:hypothetical protein
VLEPVRPVQPIAREEIRSVGHPRGTVLECHERGEESELQVAAMYLDSGLKDKAAEELAANLRRPRPPPSARLVDVTIDPKGRWPIR